MAIAITLKAGTLQQGAIYNCQTLFNAMCQRMDASAGGTSITIVAGTLPAGATFKGGQAFLEAIATRMTAVVPGSTAMPTAVPITIAVGKLPVGARYPNLQAYYEAIVPLMSATIPAIPT